MDVAKIARRHQTCKTYCAQGMEKCWAKRHAGRESGRHAAAADDVVAAAAASLLPLPRKHSLSPTPGPCPATGRRQRRPIQEAIHRDDQGWSEYAE